MVRVLLYLLFLAIVLYLLFSWLSELKLGRFPTNTGKIPSPFRSRKNRGEPWIQVYETDSETEAQQIQARLEEEEIECVVFNQGHKGIHGEELKRIGIVVAKSALSRAQKIVSRNLA